MVAAWHPSGSDSTWSHDIKSIKTHCGTFTARLPKSSTRLTPFCDQSLCCGVSPSLHRLATAMVVNVHRDDDRSAVRVTTWLYCRFRESPPESTDTTAGLMVEIRLDMSNDQQLSGALPG